MLPIALHLPVTVSHFAMVGIFTMPKPFGIYAEQQPATFAKPLLAVRCFCSLAIIVTIVEI
jgi:hypothetical protein